MQMVSEVMTRNVQFVTPQETVRRVAQMMDELNVGALPVCDGERLVGIVTDRDITVRGTSAGAVPEETVVDEVMSTDVRWCFEDQSLDEVMQQMADTQIRRVPVVTHDEEHRLVGIVSLGDVVTKSGDAQREDVRQMMEQVSSPSVPDRSSQAGTTGQNRDSGAVRASDTDTGAGLAGSDVLDAGMNRYGTSSTGDPSEVVEVTPDDLVNRNAPGATSLSPERTGAGAAMGAKDGVVVRRTSARDGDSTTGEGGAPEGIDAAGVSGASGGTAGTSGPAGTGAGAKP